MVITGSYGAELMDEIEFPSPVIRLNSDVLLSGNLQKIGSEHFTIQY